jgi:hypothetical protein
MDISKLPRLSKTEGQAPNPESSASSPPEIPVAQRAVPPYEPVARGAEAWISIGIGLIFVFAFPRFTQWGVHQVFHTKPPTFLPITDSSGAEIPYPQSVFFLSDLAVALFAYALVVDGIALLLWRKTAALTVAMLITAAAVALNAYYLIRSFADGSGFPIVSAIAVVFGGYMLWYQWRVLIDLRQHRASRTAVVG